MGKFVLNISFHANFQSEQANCNNVNDADDDDEVQESQQLKEEIQAITKIVRYFNTFFCPEILFYDGCQA